METKRSPYIPSQELDTFAKLTRGTTKLSGSSVATVGAFLIVIAWIIGGFFFGFSDTYQLYINTGTTIITFLMVFLIQAEQNRDALAIHIKLNELIRSTHADNEILRIDELPEPVLAEIREKYVEMVKTEKEEDKDNEK